MTDSDLARGGQPTEAQLYALLAGICSTVEGQVVIPDRALKAAEGRSLHIWRTDGAIRLELAADVPTRAPLRAVEAWEDTFIDGVPPELRGS